MIVALGYLGPEADGIVAQLGVELDPQGNLRTSNGFATNVPRVFAAGDTRRGQSLIIWAIEEGRDCARAMDAHLRGGDSILPSRGHGGLPRA